MALLDLFKKNRSSSSGIHFRCVGRHTRTFCKRGVDRARTQDQRGIWLLTAISADEVISSLTGLEDRRPLGALSDWPVRPPAPMPDYGAALRAYLSGLLLLYGSFKYALLQRFGLPDAQFVSVWQEVFEYGEADKALFDGVLTPAYGEGGIDGLVTAVGEQIQAALFAEGRPFGKDENDALRALLLDDLAALERFLLKQEATA